VFTRRFGVVGGALFIISGLVPGNKAFGQHSRHNPIYGCMLPRREVGIFFETATEARTYITGDEPMIPKSGDSQFDYALAQTLGKISQVLDVGPGFAYYDDHESANAYATDVPRSNGADGTVLFGQRLLKRLMASNDYPDLGVATVCAHEFGHILQYKHKLDKIVGGAQATVKRVELQADFFAGYFAGVRKKERPSFPAAVFAMTQYNAGDDMINYPSHHGTPDERADAIVRGFETAFTRGRSLSEAIETSISYVTAL
jgi:hypothetical protein